TELRHRVADVGANGLGREDELLGDAGAAGASREQREDLPLAVGEWRLQVRARRRHRLVRFDWRRRLPDAVLRAVPFSGQEPSVSLLGARESDARRYLNAASLAHRIEVRARL